MKKYTKFAVFSVGLLGFLVSCGGGFNLGQTPKISGQVAGYSGGEKVIKVATTSGTSTTIATGTLKADGSFSIDLPALATASSMSLGTCSSGTLTQTPTTAKIGTVLAGIFDTANAPTASGSLTQSDPELPSSPAIGAKQTLVARFYADVDVVITASNCVQGSATLTGTWSLKAGWNEISYLLEVTATTPSTQGKITLSMGTSGKPWRIASTSGIAPFKLPLIGQ